MFMNLTVNFELLTYHVIESVIDCLDNLLIPFVVAFFAVVLVIQVDGPVKQQKILQAFLFTSFFVQLVNVLFFSSALPCFEKYNKDVKNIHQD